MYNIGFNSAAFLDNINALLPAIGRPPLDSGGVVSERVRVRWQSVKDSVMPLVYGDMPACVIQAFDTESDRQKKYRQTVYSSRSQALLDKAIDDVQKIIQSDDFVVYMGENVAAYLEGVRIGKEVLHTETIQSQIMNAFYRLRVVDANGFIGYWFEGVYGGLRRLCLEYYPSENILYQNHEAVIVAMGNGEYRIYTRGLLALYQEATNTITPILEYVGLDLLCYVLGGRTAFAQETGENLNYAHTTTKGRTLTAGDTKPVAFFQSDFGFAVSQLNRLEILNSQNDIVNYQHAHPRIVGTQIDCPACEGKGEIHARDNNGEWLYSTEMRNGQAIETPVLHSCKSCNGKGTLPIGVQDYIEVPPMRGAMGENMGGLQSLKDTVIAYVTPDTASAKHLSEQLGEALSECKEMLNLQRFEDFSESGAAKRIDQEAGQPRLRAIAQGVATLIENIIKGAILANTTNGFARDTPANIQANLDSVRVTIPTYFDMRSLSEASAAYFENLDSKSTDTRYWEQLTLLKKRNADANEIAAFKIAYQYTHGANLLTQSELLELVGAGVLSETELWVARSIGAILDEIAKDYFNKNGEMLNYSQMFDFLPIFALIRAKQDIKQGEIEGRKNSQLDSIAAALSDNTPPEIVGANE